MSSSETQCLRKPEDTPFKQQRLPSWNPVLTPEIVVAIFIIVGIIFIPIGDSLIKASDKIYQQTIKYDGKNAGTQNCGTIGQSCNIVFQFDEDVNGPLNVYYQLENFYQNHRRYVSSRSAEQLIGTDLSTTDIQLDCDPLYEVDGKTLNPCGLIANSFFNDVIKLNPNQNYTMDETGISWKSDRDEKFLMVEGFKSKVGVTAAEAKSCNTVLGVTSGALNYTDPETNVVSCFFYPRNDEVQYLYETYPNQISPLKGVTDEHFIVWMRTAGLPTFRKLYGTIEGDFKKGDKLSFNIDLNFDVNSFDGSKSIVISTVGEFGGRNPFLGVAYIVVGSISLILGILFGIKHKLAPRKMGEVAKLHWS